MGINPVDQISKLMSHPELTERLKEPLVLSAFMDISQFPENISKYDASTQEVSLMDARGSLVRVFLMYALGQCQEN